MRPENWELKAGGLDDMLETVEQVFPSWDLLVRNNPDGARVIMRGSDTIMLGHRVFLHLSHPDWRLNGKSYKVYADTVGQAFASAMARAIEDVEV